MSALADSAIDVSVHDSVADFDATALRSTHGAYLSPSRVAQLEDDARFCGRHVVVRDRGEVMLDVPLWASRADRFSDPVVAEAIAGATGDAGDATDWLLIGGHSDAPAGVLTRAGLDDERLERLLTAARPAVAAVAREQGTGLAAPLTTEHEREAIALLCGAGAREAAVTVHARLALAGSGPEDFLASLRSHTRSRVRGEWAALDERGLGASRHEWPEVMARACPMIAANNERHGLVDHPALVRARLEPWVEATGVESVAFVVRRGDAVLALGLGLRFEQTMQVYLAGLGDPEDPDRHLAYVEATIYAPLRLAYERGCREVGLGFFAATPKRLRGARISPVVAVVTPPGALPHDD